jgi:hypothetical protein
MSLSDAIYIVSLILVIWIALGMGDGDGGKRSRQPVF